MARTDNVFLKRMDNNEPSVMNKNEATDNDQEKSGGCRASTL